ncbi:hypothetical protein D3C73_954360 [compost metagenome]
MAPFRVPPPSSRIEPISSPPRLVIAALRSTRGPAPLTTICTPASSSAARFTGSADSVVTTMVGAWPSRTTAESSGIRSAESITIRTGFSPGTSILVVKEGLSAITVLTPTIIPWWRCRSVCTISRACPLDIHLLSPVRVASFPSSVLALFSVTKGCLVRIYLMNFSFSRRARLRSSPTSTSIPCSRSMVMPRPATWGLGSSQATTTRATPSSISLWLQGGVLP